MMARSGFFGWCHSPRSSGQPGKEPTMFLDNGFAVTLRAIWVGRILGFCIYVLAFFLPACREVATAGVTTPDRYKGWFCALITLTNTFSMGVWRSKDCLAILSGWINPLILIYMILLAVPKLVWPRRIVAGAVVAFMIATWIYFALVPMVPLIGHVLWIIGALLILAGEVVGHENAPVEGEIPGPAPA
jgi:hypothetical protein